MRKVPEVPQFITFYSKRYMYLDMLSKWEVSAMLNVVERGRADDIVGALL